MKRLLQFTLLPIFCFSLVLSFACSKNNDGANIQLVSTDVVENSIISVSTGYINFIFNTNISIADTAKITLNGVSVSGAWAYDTNLKVTIKLTSGSDYTLLIDKGAIKDGSNNLNTVAFSLNFKTVKGSDIVIGGSVSQNGFLSVKGTSLVNKDGNVVVLHGVSFGWHNWWPRFYNESTVTFLNQNWKCNYVRAAIGVNADGNCYIANPASSLNCLYAVVDAAIKNDMYVIVDWHAGNILLNDAKGFFQTVAEKYKDYPNIIYEIFNEPDNTVSWTAVKSYSESVIETIRAIAPKNIILVGSPEWDQKVDLPAADPITDYDNIMYTLHFYAATHGQWLRDRATAALQKGLPIFVSECGGMGASGDGAISQTEWQAWVQWMDNNNVSWDAWCIADKNESCSMIQNTSSPVSNWTDSDLKEWGKMVRDQLKSYASN